MKKAPMERDLFQGSKEVSLAALPPDGGQRVLGVALWVMGLLPELVLPEDNPNSQEKNWRWTEVE